MTMIKTPAINTISAQPSTPHALKPWTGTYVAATGFTGMAAVRGTAVRDAGTTVQGPPRGHPR